MAITATAVLNNGGSYKSWTVTCADADTSGTINHGFGVAPDLAIIQSAISGTTTTQASWGVTVSSTQITLAKQGATGSGGTTPGTTVVAKVFAMLPNSAMQG